MTDEQLRILADLTFRLVQLRQNECKHLCIENTAPEILAKLINALLHREYRG
jgi:hypothetical protein